MARYIDADAAWKRFYELSKEQGLHPLETAYNTEYVLDFLEARDTADVQEVKHGKWKLNREFPRSIETCVLKYAICDKCGDFSPIMSKYCPNCGAEMGGDT